jgi:hypothetical protein
MGRVVFSVALWEAGPFEPSLKSFVVDSIVRMRSMGLWEMLLRAVKARKGRGKKKDGGKFDGPG